MSILDTGIVYTNTIGALAGIDGIITINQKMNFKK